MLRIRVMRLSNLIYILIVALLIAAIVFLAYRLIIRDPVSFSPILINEEDNGPEQYTVSPIYRSMLAGGFPAIAAADGGGGGQSIFAVIWSILTNRDMRDPRSIVDYQMPYLDSSIEVPDNAVAVSGSLGLPDRSSVDRSTDPIEIIQGGSEEDSYYEVSEEIKILINEIEVDEKPIELSGKGPQILIYHSHSREAYMQDPSDPYVEAFAEDFRTDDTSHSILKIGEALTNHLTQRGIPVLHDVTDHEKEDYNASYSKSLETIRKRMAENESLQMFIDIHRNGYEKGAKKDPDDEVVIINGKRVAKVFVVIGTGEGVMGGFSEKPKWQENAKMAIKLTNKLNELYPGLAKDVLYKKGRFNQHVSTNAILIEVGSTFTTQKEAELATMYIAEALSQIID